MVKFSKMISVDEELFERLKKEENASALICSLLYKYYQTDETDIGKIESRLQELENLKINQRVIDEIKELEEHKNKIIKTQEEADSKILHRTSIEEKRIKRQELFFAEIGRYMTDEEMKEFERRFNEEGIGILQFIEEKKGNEVKEAEKVLDIL